ncbi:MAG TPA: M23 family metallopeptidase [Smithellaceae bacterium]|nr:M23 family metallopeptidase [Smithellaceae bacterium]HRS89637.1 M23 family metallopeptidase [Smithellaceae bacterium]HRV25807.1 M23 family metallopeptidase [Smithellaceae bacterium]
MKNHYRYLIIAGAFALSGLFCWLFFFNYLETEKPQITPVGNLALIGINKKIEIEFSDQKSGLAVLRAEITQNEKVQVIFAEKISTGGIRQKSVVVIVKPREIDLEDGPARLSISAQDRSLFRNTRIYEQEIIIDTHPPQIFQSAEPDYFAQGGTAIIAYRVSKPVEEAGIYHNDIFLPSHKAKVGQNTVYYTMLAVPLYATKDNFRLHIYARDEAGNETTVIPAFFIQERIFRSDSVSLSESFLKTKMPEFQSVNPPLHGKSPAEIFAFVNSQLRADNDRQIQNICQKLSDKKLWDGTFLRMRGAAIMARFGDRRAYLTAGKTLGNSIHLGVDLASTANAPIEAANSGVVVFAQELGIYGNTVIIDHGQGLFSLYAHLSSILVKKSQSVKKEQIIGHSGLTGLAGGDHLHFSMLVGGNFVNPFEWWDHRWIENNFQKKMYF